MSRVSNEPVLWLPFSGGGMFAALFIPIHVLLFGIAIPLGLVPDPGAEGMAALVAGWGVRLYLLALVAGCLIHAAHRIRYLLIELGWRVLRVPTAILCYALAIGGSAWAAWVVLTP